MNKNQQHILFLELDHYINCKRENCGASTTSKGVWVEALSEVGSFVGIQQRELCVDEKTSGMEHLMTVLLSYMRKLHINVYFEDYHDDGEGLLYQHLVEVLRKAGYTKLVDVVCCHKMDQPSLHCNQYKPYPRFILCTCTHGEGGDVSCMCPWCRILWQLKILDALADAEWAEDDEVVPHY